MPKKLNNDRRWPDANHQPCQDAKLRKTEALERQAAYNALSVQEKIALLDRRLGVGVGAVKQRARLAAQLEKQNKPKQDAAPVKTQK